MSHIGIFWVHQGHILASPVSLDVAVVTSGIADSPKNHVSLWPQIQRKHPDLRDLEYLDVPRGRVVFYQRTQRFTVYLDKSLLKHRVKTDLLKRLCSSGIEFASR